jgi:hypothetical protein
MNFNEKTNANKKSKPEKKLNFNDFYPNNEFCEAKTKSSIGNTRGATIIDMERNFDKHSISEFEIEEDFRVRKNSNNPSSRFSVFNKALNSSNYNQSSNLIHPLQRAKVINEEMNIFFNNNNNNNNEIVKNNYINQNFNGNNNFNNNPSNFHINNQPNSHVFNDNFFYNNINFGNSINNNDNKCKYHSNYNQIINNQRNFINQKMLHIPTNGKKLLKIFLFNNI